MMTSLLLDCIQKNMKSILLEWEVSQLLAKPLNGIKTRFWDALSNGKFTKESRTKIEVCVKDTR